MTGVTGDAPAAAPPPGVPEPHSPAPWIVEFQRSPPLTILFSLAILMALLVLAAVLPPYFLLPAAALIAVVANGEIRPILAEKRLARRGRVVAGNVTGLAPLKRIKKHPFESNWTLSYRITIDGRTHDGRSRPLPWQVVREIEPGASIAIHLDPDDAERSAWIGG